MREAKQQKKVLAYLRSHEFLTGATALEELRVYRLSEVVRRLRAIGYDIETVRNTEPNADGEVIPYGKYHLKEDI